MKNWASHVPLQDKRVDEVIYHDLILTAYKYVIHHMKFGS